MFLTIFIVFIFGTVIGSFLNVCSMRIPEDESISFPPSHCDSCGTYLKYRDMIPILSYLIYRGRCRYCGAKLSVQYPIVEAISGAISVTLFLLYGFGIEFYFYLVVFYILFVIAIIDWNTQYIIDIMVVAVVIVGILLKIYLYFHYDLALGEIIKDSIFGLLIGAGTFYTIYLLSRGAMGEGDIVLVGGLGILLGVEKIIVLMFFAFVIGAFVSVILLALGLKSRKDAIAFGPFIVISFYITVIFGDMIVNYFFYNYLYYLV